jgi:hypothetical protein
MFTVSFISVFVSVSNPQLLQQLFNNDCHDCLTSATLLYTWLLGGHGHNLLSWREQRVFSKFNFFQNILLIFLKHGKIGKNVILSPRKGTPCSASMLLLGRSRCWIIFHRSGAQYVCNCYRQIFQGPQSSQIQYYSIRTEQDLT